MILYEGLNLLVIYLVSRPNLKITNTRWKNQRYCLLQRFYHAIYSYHFIHLLRRRNEIKQLRNCSTYHALYCGYLLLLCDVKSCKNKHCCRTTAAKAAIIMCQTAATIKWKNCLSSFIAAFATCNNQSCQRTNKFSQHMSFCRHTCNTHTA